MNRRFRLLLPLLVLAGITGLAFKKEKKRIVFFGDSITQAGVGPEGYITKLGQMLQKNDRSADYDLIGAGIGGNKIYDLYLRLETDVLSKKPDAVVIWVGVNDVWHKRTSGTGTDADKFEKFYNALIDKLKQNNISVYLVTPATIGEKADMTNELDGDLNKYAGIIRNVAKSQNCPIIDLRKAFQGYLPSHNPENKDRGILTGDGVHLNNEGNQFVADAMYKVLF